MNPGTGLGVGIGWRREIDLTVERLPGLGFVEAIAEDLVPSRLPASLRALRRRGVPVVPHAVSLSLGGAEPPSRAHLEHLTRVVEALGAPLAGDHVAFVRAGGLDAGHLLPVPRTRDGLAVLVENTRRAQDALPVPLALENIAPLFAWDDAELDEGAFLTELVERTGCWLLVDVANLYAAERNGLGSAEAALDRLPHERIAYVHVAGGIDRDGLYHDTHAHPVPDAVHDLLARLCSHRQPPGVMLERDDRFPRDDELAAELTTIADVCAGRRRAPR